MSTQSERREKVRRERMESSASFGRSQEETTEPSQRHNQKIKYYSMDLKKSVVHTFNVFSDSIKV